MALQLLANVAITALASLPVLFMLLPVLTSDEQRAYFSQYPLGLKGKSKKSHAIREVSDKDPSLAWAVYLATLNGGARATMQKKISKAFTANGVTVKSVTPSKLAFRHFLIILAHERSMYILPKALFAAWARFCSARMMVGVVDEYYITEQDELVLVAWNQLIAKGDSIRGMWFYQSEVARSRGLCIWFDSIRSAIFRASMMPGIKYVDLGPSTSAASKESKVSYGFEDCATWSQICDYNSAGFSTPPPYEAIKFVSEGPDIKKRPAVPHASGPE